MLWSRARVLRRPWAAVTGNGFPDNQEHIKATYDYMVQNGVPLDQSTFVYDAGQLRHRSFHIPGGGEDNETLLVVGIPGTREQTVIKAGRTFNERLYYRRTEPAARDSCPWSTQHTCPMLSPITLPGETAC